MKTRNAMKLAVALAIVSALSIVDIRAHEEKSGNEWSYPEAEVEALVGPVYRVEFPGPGQAREVYIRRWQCLIIGDRWSFTSQCIYRPPAEELERRAEK